MKILLTGMSGTGTSSVLEHLARRGWDVVDTDYGDWKVAGPDGDLVWDESKITELLTTQPANRRLAVDGCVSNQGRFYGYFDAVVLLTAPIEVMLERVTRRTNNDYGKTPDEQEEIRANTRLVVPLLRPGADLEIDSGATSIEEICDRIERFLKDR